MADQLYSALFFWKNPVIRKTSIISRTQQIHFLIIQALFWNTKRNELFCHDVKLVYHDYPRRIRNMKHKFTSILWVLISKRPEHQESNLWTTRWYCKCGTIKVLIMKKIELDIKNTVYYIPQYYIGFQIHSLNLCMCVCMHVYYSIYMVRYSWMLSVTVRRLHPIMSSPGASRVQQG